MAAALGPLQGVNHLALYWAESPVEISQRLGVALPLGCALDFAAHHLVEPLWHRHRGALVWRSAVFPVRR